MYVWLLAGLLPFIANNLVGLGMAGTGVVKDPNTVEPVPSAS
jgi:hypothetical protein